MNLVLFDEMFVSKEGDCTVGTILNVRVSNNIADAIQSDR